MKLKENFLPTLKFLIGWPLSLVALFFIIKMVIGKTHEIKPYLNNIDYLPLILGFTLFISYFLLRSFLWLQILKSLGKTISFKENTYRFSFSEMKRYVPGNLWSFLSRASMFEDAGIDRKSVGVAIIADIQLVVIGCGLASLISIPWIIDSSQALSLQLSSVVPISIIAIIFYFFATGYLYKRKYAKDESLIKNIFLPGISLHSKIVLSLYSAACYMIFGFANFFILQSVIPSFELILTLSSFFVFSLLVGYLSFITPMGLGVREAVVTLGLTKIMSTTSAGFVAIFTRLMLITSELIFLLIILIWQKIPLKK